MSKGRPLAALAAIMLATTTAYSAEYGTAEEATALLTRAVEEMKADPGAAIAKFNDPDGAFRDRDLYVFCAGAEDGILTAHPALVGTDLRTIKDINGKPLGAEILDTAAESTVAEVSYVWPRPDGTDPIDKTSFVTKIGDQVCGVGYYKD